MTTEFWARSVATILADPKTDTDCRQRLTGELQSIADAALAAGVEIDGLVNDAPTVPPVSPPTSEPSHTPGPIAIADGRHVVGTYGNMLRLECAEPFCSSGQDYPDGGSTKCYSHVVCGVYGNSPTAIANAERLANCWNSHDDIVAACKGLLDAIHDSMTHESQAFHADAINTAKAAIAKGGAL